MPDGLSAGFYLGLLLAPALLAAKWVLDVFEETDRRYDLRVAEVDLIRAIDATETPEELHRLLFDHDLLVDGNR